MSGNFKFRLQKVLDIRREKEEESKRIFKESQSQLHFIKEEFKELEDKFNENKVFKSDEDMVFRRIKLNYLEFLKVKIENKKLEIIEKEKEIQINREDLINKQVERKTVEKLKEKEKENFYKEINRIEQINNDEFGLYSYMRNKERGNSK